MKKLLIYLIVITLTVSIVFVGIGCKGAAAEEEVAGAAAEEEVSEGAVEEEVAEGAVTITTTSWRVEDIPRVERINAVFMEKNPNIIVEFKPIADVEYDAQVYTALEGGVGHDIITLRPYDLGAYVFKGGFLTVLNDVIDGLEENFPSEAADAWRSDDGEIYGIPIVGISQGVYYHKDVFDKYGLEEPETWAEFMEICQILKDGGETVLANGIAHTWNIQEILYVGFGGNFYGGEESRQALMAGEMKMTDEPFVEAFRKVNELVPFLPKGFESFTYYDMLFLFGNKEAAMIGGGSWEISIWEEEYGLTDYGWFPFPVAKEGDPIQYVWHPDMGMALNKDSKNHAAALEYMQWLATEELAKLFMDELPGFWSFFDADFTFENAMQQEQFDLSRADNVKLHKRLFYEKISMQDPSGTILAEEALVKMVTGEFTPEEAAAHVQEGLETWYEPFME